VLTSAGWFVVTTGAGVVLVPWWLTGWRLPRPVPWFGLSAAVGVVMIAVGLIPPVHVFAQFVRSGGTPVPGAMTKRLRDRANGTHGAATWPRAIFPAGACRA